MTEDIAARCRRMHEQTGAPTYREAAEEIQRLRELLSDLISAASGMPASHDSLCQGALDHAVLRAEEALS